jgi:hypothetical protein
MVVMPAAIVANRHAEFGNISDYIIQISFSGGIAFQCFVQVGNIGRMMFSMMDFHCGGINVRFQRIAAIW